MSDNRLPVYVIGKAEPIGYVERFPKTYKIGDGFDGWFVVRGDERVFDVLSELGLDSEPYCDGCELPVEACACADAREYDDAWAAEADRLARHAPPWTPGLYVQEYGRALRPQRPNRLAEGATAIACAIVGLVVVTLLILALT